MKHIEITLDRAKHTRDTLKSAASLTKTQGSNNKAESSKKQEDSVTPSSTTPKEDLAMGPIGSRVRLLMEEGNQFKEEAQRLQRQLDQLCAQETSLLQSQDTMQTQWQQVQRQRDFDKIATREAKTMETRCRQHSLSVETERQWCLYQAQQELMHLQEAIDEPFAGSEPIASMERKGTSGIWSISQLKARLSKRQDTIRRLQSERTQWTQRVGAQRTSDAYIALCHHLHDLEQLRFACHSAGAKGTTARSSRE